MKIIDNVTAYFSRASLGSTQAFGEFAGRVVSCISEKSSTSAISGLFFASTVLAFITYKSRYCPNSVSIERDNVPVRPFEEDEDAGEPRKIVGGESEDDGVFANEDFIADQVYTSEDTAANSFSSSSSEDVGDSGFKSTIWSLDRLITQIKEAVFGKSVTSQQVSQEITSDLDEGSQKVFNGNSMMLNVLQLGNLSINAFLDNYQRIDAENVFLYGKKLFGEKKTINETREEIEEIARNSDKFPKLCSIILVDTALELGNTYFDERGNLCSLKNAPEGSILEEQKTRNYLKNLFRNKNIRFSAIFNADYSQYHGRDCRKR